MQAHRFDIVPEYAHPYDRTLEHGWRWHVYRCRPLPGDPNAREWVATCASRAHAQSIVNLETRVSPLRERLDAPQYHG